MYARPSSVMPSLQVRGGRCCSEEMLFGKACSKERMPIKARML